MLQNIFEYSLFNIGQQFAGFVSATKNVVVVLCNRGQVLSTLMQILTVDCLFSFFATCNNGGWRDADVVMVGTAVALTEVLLLHNS